jgi:hypothetical protein
VTQHLSATANGSGLRNLLRHGYAQNQVRSEIVALACALLACSTPG